MEILAGFPSSRDGGRPAGWTGIDASARWSPSLAVRALPWGAALAVVVVRILYAEATGLVYEDALVTFRYAENLAAGHGFVFNPGERVLGTTTPLFALLLTPVALLAGAEAIAPAATVVGILCAGIATLLLFRIGRALALPVAVPLGAALLLAVAQEVVAVDVGGMETPLVVALMLGVFVLALEQRPLAAGAVAAALVICRVDALLWVGLVGLQLWAHGGRFPWRGLAAFAGGLLPWAVFAAAYFGSPVPHTIAAKTVAYELGPLAERLRALWGPLHPYQTDVPLGWILDGFFVSGALVALRRCRPLLVPAAFTVLHLGALLFAPSLGAWYLVPPTVTFFLVASLGAWALVRGGWSGPAAARVLGVGIPAGLAVFVLYAASVRTTLSVPFLRAFMENERAVRQAMGEWIRDRTPAGATVFAEPIGFLGFHSRRYVWDTVGLVSPRMTAYRRRHPGNAWFEVALRELRPDLVVLRRFERPENRMFVHGRPLLGEAGMAWFDAQYVPVRTFVPPHPTIAPDWEFTVYLRRDAPFAQKKNVKN